MTESLDQRALRIAQAVWRDCGHWAVDAWWHEKAPAFSEFARRLFAEQAQQEPVAWQYHQRGPHESKWQEWHTVGHKPQGPESPFFQMRPLYAAPQQDSLDAKRLDWMELNVSAIRDIGWLGGSLRAAIDAAMREGGK